MYTVFTSKKKIVFSYKVRSMWSCGYEERTLSTADGYMETVCPCSSKEIAEKVARSYSRGKVFICYEEKEV